MEPVAAALPELMGDLLEYIGCQTDPELRVLALRVESAMQERFKCGHLKSLGNMYPRCKVCQLDLSRGRKR